MDFDFDFRAAASDVMNFHEDSDFSMDQIQQDLVRLFTYLNSSSIFVLIYLDR